MSQNPFENFTQPMGEGPSGNAPGTLADSVTQPVPPGGLTPIAIICLVFAILGILGAIFTMLTPLFLGWLEGLMESALQSMSQEERDRQMKALALASEGQVWTVAFGVINFIDQLAMIIACVRCLSLIHI